MKAIVCTVQGLPVAPNIAFQADWPELEPPEPGELQLRTLASAFNHMDLWVGRGVPGLELTYPRVSGCDACAEVEAVGERVDPSWIGRRVICNAATEVSGPVRPDDPSPSTLAPDYELVGEHHWGMHRERFCLPADNCAPIAADRDPIEAAAFGLTFLTAYSMMFTKGTLHPGQSVLITGIGGGVATSALALAKHLGCPTAVTSRHPWKLDKARDLGADEAILDTGEDWSRAVRAWTNKRGVDMAVDSVGKATHLSCIKSLARGGAYVTPGCTTGPDATTDLARIFWNQLRILGSTMGGRSEFLELAALFNAGKLAPVVDSVFKPEDGQNAYERLEAAEQFGKIIIDWR
ncbi:MAG: zinc-binding dehydrogenase [Planctomycetota bacterium]